jgi:hypothetical protein
MCKTLTRYGNSTHFGQLLFPSGHLFPSSASVSYIPGEECSSVVHAFTFRRVVPSHILGDEYSRRLHFTAIVPAALETITIPHPQYTTNPKNILTNMTLVKETIQLEKKIRDRHIYEETSVPAHIRILHTTDFPLLLPYCRVPTPQVRITTDKRYTSQSYCPPGMYVIYTYPPPPPGTGCHPSPTTTLRKPPPNLQHLLLLGWGSWDLAQHRGIHVLVVVVGNVSCLPCVVVDHVLILVINKRNDVQQNDTWYTTIIQAFQKQDPKTPPATPCQRKRRYR